MNSTYRENILNKLVYRRLLIDELFENEPEKEFQKLLEALTDLENDGFIVSESALTKSGRTWLCTRCGNLDSGLFGEVKICGRCGKKCAYCRSCLIMGRVMGCSRF
ncbi:hypothetical protein [Alkalicoccus halolimnae]|uniref:Uncharacterized protein n=1 Tax=Alkalicoccus halolimnae TaxID=1667239 RepID=A0A5C7F8C5_9BACI|nr:hypothetical protein [Alkalicoccus halolimnae]TXF85628.1 hypothetical protein FTX54_08545 [Alkalicoccus halolimnae]